MRILIAEDDPVSCLALTESLKNLGHEVVATENGRDAWTVFLREHLQLLISDWMMPHIDGLELCRMIRSENRTKYTYIILLTALGGKGSYLEGMKAGADDFITKPFDVDELAARLHVADRILNLQAEVKQLQRLLPICSYCRRIRDKSNVWTGLEEYIGKQTETSFTHSVCPDCYETELAPELAELKAKRI
jgi:sigma-B regulation protein RsbU (phosphoserine phosphatase)